MGYFKQLRLLIHHKLLLRRRQPTILALEIFWPAIVFLTVFLVRLQFLPEDQPTCYYNSKALPSAGAVNFIQSLVCSLDNPCIDSSSYHEVPSYPNARIHKLVDHLSPLLTDKNVTGSIKELPKGIRLVATIVDTLIQPEVKSILEQGIPIREILRASGDEKVETFLRDALGASLDANAFSAELLVNASLNIVKISRFSRKSVHRPLKELLCSPDQLNDILLLNNQSMISGVSEALCSLHAQQVHSLLKLMQSELDFSKILMRLASILHYVGLPDTEANLRSMANMIETMDKTRIFSASSGVFNSGFWADGIPSLIKGYRSGQQVVGTLSKIASDIEPLFKTREPEDPTQKFLQNLASQSQAVKPQPTVEKEPPTQTYFIYDEDRHGTVMRKPGDIDLESDEEFRIETHEVGNFDTPEQLDGDLLMVESAPHPVSVRPPPSLKAQHRQAADESASNFGSGRSAASARSSKRFTAMHVGNGQLMGHLDRVIDDLENLTLSTKWPAFIRVFRAVESVLDVYQDTTKKSKSGKSEAQDEQLPSLTEIREHLPRRTQDIALALNHLAAHHSLPWANQPLLDTLKLVADQIIDALHLTKENGHIHHLPELFDLLLTSWEKGNLPKTCGDWTNAMCSRKAFILTLQVNSIPNSEHFHNLSCALFGAKGDSVQTARVDGAPLNWGELANKLVDIYVYAKDALPFSHWEQMFNATHYTWNYHGVSERLIMGARIVQLMADCYVPESLQHDEVWKHVYKYKNVANQILHVIIDEINHSSESENLVVDQISFGSPALADILNKGLELVPDIMKAFTRAVTEDLPGFVDRAAFAQNAWIHRYPCKGASLADLFPRHLNANKSSILEVEAMICNQTWKGLSGEGFGGIIDELIGNPRIAAIVLTLQNPDDTDLHGSGSQDELFPQLNWVEAGTSVALLHEALHRVASMERPIHMFPDIHNFDSRARGAYKECVGLAKHFFEASGSKAIPAYLLDVMVPVRRIVNNFVKLIRQGIITKASLAGDDIPRALEGLKEAARAMPYVKGFVSNFTDSMNMEEELADLDLRGDGIDLLGSPQAAEITAQLMCGKPLPMLSSEFDLFKAAKGLKKSKINEAELEALPSQFCQSGYKQIMRMSGGPVVWSFLKPILAGKILYTPKNALTDGIMRRMNGTFTFMHNFKNTLEAWTKTISSLEAFYKNPDMNSRVQSVQPLVAEFLGKHVEGLFDDMDASRVLSRLASSGGILGLIQLVGSVAQCFQLERFIGFDTELELEEAARTYTKAHELIAGVVFMNVDGEVMPKNVEYKIRADIDFVPTTKMLKERMWEPGPRADYVKHLGYLRGFVQVQEMIDRAITMVHIQRDELPIAPAVHLQQFPYLCYQEDKFGLYIRALTPVIATVAWIFLIAFMIRERVLERELHLEEVMRVMGLKPSVAWLTWFLIGFVVMAFGSACGIGILKVARLIPYSDTLLLYLYFITFCFSIIMYCYMMSSFFKTATIASLSGIVAYLASYLPFMVAITLEHDMTFLHKAATCLSMSTSFCFGMMYMSRYEAQGAGVQWTNIWQSPMSDDPMNFGTAGVMMLIDGVIYFLIGWYISNVHPPGNNGHHEPWYFFILPRYWGWTSKSHGRNLPPHLHGININGKSSKYCLENGFLEASWQRRPGMSLHNLFVIYNKGSKNEHTAVSDLSLELKEGQITTLLGRNGAGKTTTISVLTGQLPPTTGSVYVYGHQVPQEFTEARKLLGYCPQYNTLFKELTVREHLRFFSDLKGLLKENEIEEDVDQMLHNTGLWHIQHEMAKNLSGGLQRRLCVALAFVGGSKLIILDEPTSSVDPVARRSIWDLIVQQKQSRTVLLTTHHMDEADILSDQCAVIHRGKLLCNGSPLLLRSKYGCGYKLTVSRQGDEVGDSDSGRASNEFQDETNDSDKLLAFTKCLIPNATLIEEYASEIVLALPHQGPDGSPHDYATFFRCLDSNIHTLGFGSYGLTSATLEEVFLSLCGMQEPNSLVDDHKPNLSRSLTNPMDAETTATEIRKQFDQTFNTFDWSAPSLVDGVSLKFKQLWALLAKRAYHAFRDWKSVFCNLLLPCMFIAFAMGMTLIKPRFAPDPILPLSPVIYGHGATSFVSLFNNSNNANNQLIAKELMDRSLFEPTCPKPRFGWKVAKCPILRGFRHDESVILPDYLRTLEGPEWTGSDAAFSDCDDSANGTDVIAQYAAMIPDAKPTGLGYLYDLSNTNVSDFLLRTFSQFNDRRFGGFSFHKQDDSTRNENVAKVWFDNNGFHSMTAYLSALDEAIMKANIRETGLNPDEYSITTFSHPFHIRSSQIGDQSLMQRAGDAGIALIILVGFIFIPTSFVFYIVRERTQEEKQLQKIFGVGTFLYWFSAILWDMLTVLLAVTLSGAIIFCFQMPIYTARLNLPGVLVLLFLFGWAMTSLVYLMEKFFNEPSIAFMVIYCLSLFVGIMTMVMRLLIDVFEILVVSPTFKATFERVAIVFPPYALMSGLVDITRNQLFSEIFTLFDQDMYVSPFSMELLGPHYVSLAIEGAVFFVLNLIIELCSNWNLSSGRKPSASPYINEDSDVAEERRRVTQESSRFDILRVNNVSKVFQSMFGKRIAVDHVSFAVPRGECFGLLGVNGAGKTTLFRMLTGQLKPSAGETIINRMNISKLLSSSCQFLGYCPQADALDGVLSPKEHLTIYSEMRGIPTMHVPLVVADSIAKFQLTIHADMPVDHLSRGTKRKLCLAIAMVGSPQIVLLDEPTSGMDPMSRRCLWHNIQSAVRDRRSVLLTSHSMEECDILCSRLAIMVNGRFRCIGSPQYLKNKFGAGYTVALRLSEGSSNWNDAISYMKQSFPACILRAHHHNMLEFSLPTNDLSLSTIFNNLQSAKETLQLQDFSVSQTTLDQVFVSFANQQVNDFHREPVPSATAQPDIKAPSAYTNVAFVSSTQNLSKPQLVMGEKEKVRGQVKVQQVPREIERVQSRKVANPKSRAPQPMAAKGKERQQVMAPNAGLVVAPPGLHWKPSQRNTRTTRF